VVLFIELLEAACLDAYDPLGGCNPYAVLTLGPHEVIILTVNNSNQK